MDTIRAWNGESLYDLRYRLGALGVSHSDVHSAAEHVKRMRVAQERRRIADQLPKSFRAPIPDLIGRIWSSMAIGLGEHATLSAALLGPTGCGKTTAAAILVLRCLPEHLHWCHASELVHADRYHRLGEGEPPAITAARRAGALVLDDIGTDCITPAFGVVLNHRYQEGLPTIVTSGLTLLQLNETLGSWALRRIRQQHSGHEVLVVDCHGGKS